MEDNFQIMQEMEYTVYRDKDVTYYLDGEEVRPTLCMFHPYMDLIFPLRFSMN